MRIIPAMIFLAFRAVLSALAFLFIGIETKGRSIEEIDAALTKPVLVSSGLIADPENHCSIGFRTEMDRLFDRFGLPSLRRRQTPSVFSFMRWPTNLATSCGRWRSPRRQSRGR